MFFNKRLLIEVDRFPIFGFVQEGQGIQLPSDVGTLCKIFMAICLHTCLDHLSLAGDASVKEHANRPSASHNAAGPSWSPGWGVPSELNRPDSSDLTLASELLGIPTATGFHAKVSTSWPISSSLFLSTFETTYRSSFWGVHDDLALIATEVLQILYLSQMDLGKVYRHCPLRIDLETPVRLFRADQADVSQVDSTEQSPPHCNPQSPYFRYACLWKIRQRRLTRLVVEFLTNLELRDWSSLNAGHWCCLHFWWWGWFWDWAFKSLGGAKFGFPKFWWSTCCIWQHVQPRIERSGHFPIFAYPCCVFARREEFASQWTLFPFIECLQLYSRRIARLFKSAAS